MRAMRRRVTRSFGSKKPQNVQWADVSGQFLLNGITATTAVILVQLQAPASLAALTSDPPEDLTILRMRGTFGVFASVSTAFSFTLALLVQDVTWTPGATFTVDADKRILWSRTFLNEPASTAAPSWQPPGTYLEAGGTRFPTHPSIITVDIAPKVRVQSGQALHLVGYENSGAFAGTVISSEMRVLYKRSGRR